VTSPLTTENYSPSYETVRKIASDLLKHVPKSLRTDPSITFDVIVVAISEAIRRDNCAKVKGLGEFLVVKKHYVKEKPPLFAGAVARYIRFIPSRIIRDHMRMSDGDVDLLSVLRKRNRKLRNGNGQKKNYKKLTELLT